MLLEVEQSECTSERLPPLLHKAGNNAKIGHVGDT